MRCQVTMSSLASPLFATSLSRMLSGRAEQKNARTSSRNASSSAVKRRSMTRTPCSSGCRGGEAAALGGEATNPSCGPQGLVPRPFGINGQPVAEVSEPQPIGVVHRPTAPDRPAIAIHPYYVDVAGTCGDALFENARTFVDHREDHALDDLLLRDRPAGDSGPGRSIEDGAFNLGVGHRSARSGIIAKISLSGLLAKMTGLAQRILDLVALAAALADPPADIEPGHVGHRKRSHRKPEAGDRGIDLLRQGAFEQQPLGLDRTARQHAVADKSVAYADRDRNLGEPAAERYGGGERVGRGLGTAHDLQQPHDVCRAEKMRAAHILRLC